MRIKFNKFYKNYILPPFWVEKLKSYIEPHFPWTSNIQKDYPWVPINSLWFSLKWSHINFFRFMNNRYAIPTLIVFALALLLLNILYLLSLVVFILYWLIKFLIFLCKPGVKIVKPTPIGLNFKNKTYLLLFLYCIHRPYLLSYSILYKILKYSTFNKNKVNYKTISTRFIILTLLLFICYLISYLISLPLRVIRDSYIWSREWRYFPLSMYDSLAIKIRECSLRIALLVFSNIQKIELYKVFRVNGNVRFNPLKNLIY